MMRNQMFAFVAPPAVAPMNGMNGLNGLSGLLGPLVIELVGLNGAAADPCAPLRQRIAELESLLPQLNSQLGAARLDAAQTRQALVALQQRLDASEASLRFCREDLFRERNPGITSIPTGVRG